MREREKRASALIKRISAFGIIHAAQSTVSVKPGKKSLSLDYSCSLRSCRATDGEAGTFDTPSYNLLLWLADEKI